MEDASAFWPVTVDIASFEESITLFKEEMVGDELITLSIGQGTERIEGAC